MKPTVYAISKAEGFVQVVGILGTSALFFLAIAASAVLLQTRRTGAPAAPRDDEVAVLAASQERIRTLLYVGALSLVAGTLQSSALYSWAGSMLSSRSIGTVGADAVEYFAKGTDIAQTMGMLNGSFYSLMLATIFVPAFALLRVKALLLAHEADPAAAPADRKAWLEGKGIGASVHTHIVTAAALLAPAITGGPVTTLLTMFSG